MQLYKEQQEEFHSNLKSELKVFKKAKGGDKDSAEDRITSLLQSARKNIRRYEQQITQHKNNEGEKSKNEKEWKRALTMNEKSLKNFYEDLDRLKRDFKKAKTQGERDDLYGDADEEMQEVKEKSSKPKDDEDLNEEMAKKLFADVYEVQDENMQIVLGLVRKADDAIEMGAQTNAKLRQQNEQMRGINEELDNLQGHIKRARNEVNSFMRGIATDKLLLVGICLVIALIFTAVVLVIVCKAGVCKLICTSIPDLADKCPEIIM